MFDEISASDAGGFEMRTGGKDEVASGETFFGDSDGVRIEKISEAFDASNAGVFVDFFVVAAGFDNGFELAGGDGR